MTPTAHCCTAMTAHLAGGELALAYDDRFRQYGIEHRAGLARGIQLITFCPWCGAKLPKDLVDEWFGVLDNELGLASDDPALPEAMKTSAWWRQRGL
jgi:hypothetical protein